MRRRWKADKLVKCQSGALHALPRDDVNFQWRDHAPCTAGLEVAARAARPACLAVSPPPALVPFSLRRLAATSHAALTRFANSGVSRSPLPLHVSGADRSDARSQEADQQGGSAPPACLVKRRPTDLALQGHSQNPATGPSSLRAGSASPGEGGGPPKPTCSCLPRHSPGRWHRQSWTHDAPAHRSPAERRIATLRSPELSSHVSPPAQLRAPPTPHGAHSSARVRGAGDGSEQWRGASSARGPRREGVVEWRVARGEWGGSGRCDPIAAPHTGAWGGGYGRIRDGAYRSDHAD
jgi:hypothetical protein